MIVMVAVLLGTAAALIPAPVALPQPVTFARPVTPPRASGRGWSRVVRPIAGALGLYVVIGGPVGLIAGIAAALVLARRSRVHEVQDPSWAGAAPVAVALIAAATRAGVPASHAVSTAAAVLDPIHAGGLARVVERWRYGLSALEVDLDRPTRMVAQAIEQTHDSGAAPALALEHAAAELIADGATQAHERARRVGVRAALPLGVCLLPAFLCLGVAPLVAGLIGSLSR